jgi:hypothetical protein
MRKAATFAAAVLLAGCGTIMHGTHQDISISSTPQGAKFETAPVTGTYTTPATVTLERNHEYVLTFSKEGYTPATLNIRKDIGPGTVIADVLLGIIPLIIDAATGAWYGLSPESATVTLARVGGSELDADAIQVAVTTIKGRGTFEVKSNSPSGVSFQLKRR